MTIELNHTIVWSHDKAASAAFLAGVLDVPIGEPVGPFLPIMLSNGITLDFADTQSEVQAQHYAFLVDDDVFDAAFARIRAAGLTYYADPGYQQPGTINHHNGGRGVYFADPDGHIMELQTVALDGATARR